MHASDYVCCVNVAYECCNFGLKTDIFAIGKV